MTLGCTVVANAATCVPDVVGDAGIVRPLVAEQWVAALDEARRRRTELVAAGHERARAFTSKVSGAALSAAYAAALERT
jgi:glycosyltransferase involved in cell wall biosynthesis